MTHPSPAALTRALLDAYATQDREAAEQLIAPDFRFTSPLDNGLDRATYFEVCWPASRTAAGFEIVRLIEDGEVAVVTYLGASREGTGRRNTEVIRTRDGQVTEVEVYFGWAVPHPAAPGTHAEQA
jgi:ketosteroid isomerase-like protein